VGIDDVCHGAAGDAGGGDQLGGPEVGEGSAEGEPVAARGPAMKRSWSGLTVWAETAEPLRAKMSARAARTRTRFFIFRFTLLLI